MPAISGSMVRGNYAGRFSIFANNTTYTIHDRQLDASGKASTNFIHDRQLDASVTFSYNNSISSSKSSLPKVWGFIRSIAMGGATSPDSSGNFGNHMTYGLTKETVQGSPTPPSLRLDYPSNWRFRWIVNPGVRTISVNAQQYITSSASGSFTPSVIVKANPNVGLKTDISGSIPNILGWQTIGPLSFTATNTDVVWVELHHNNYVSFLLGNGCFTEIPSSSVYFDHIVVT